MKEPLSNMGPICKDCSEERHKEWQERNRHLLIHLDDWCKIAFTEGKKTEHMFVKVFKITTGGREDMQQQLVGRLDNDPVYLKKIKCGDEVSFLFSQIEQVFREGEMI